jgi:5-oxopent-3-ene-1,2,5-tricarboxylate decarboxylase/2-hydroxyhepta-2,4-diene-1,7-dioate isomerase
MLRVRILHNGSPQWGELRDGSVRLDGGGEVDAEQACWLAPVEPTKIIAVHLTYQSRLTEYRRTRPPSRRTS